MGRKINPIAFRLSVNKDWRSRWFATGKEYSQKLHADLKIRAYIEKRFHFSAISKVHIDRAWNSIRVTIHTGRPGVIIGRKGAEIEKITQDLQKFAINSQVKVDIVEIREMELEAQLVAEQIATQLERRVNFRRAMKRAMQTVMQSGAEGIRLRVSGRLGGVDIARAEWYAEGKVPLQTLRVPVDYGVAEASTTYGIIGVSCWINKKPRAGKKNNRGGRSFKERREQRQR